MKLCWLMVCQDPPVALECSKNNMDLYRAYTKSGDTVDYIVWPSLLLHDDGPLLYKGVAQLKFDKSSDENSPNNNDDDNTNGANEECSKKSLNQTTAIEEKKEESKHVNETDFVESIMLTMLKKNSIFVARNMYVTP